MIYQKHFLFAGPVRAMMILGALVLLGTGWAVNTAAQTANKSAPRSVIQQPLYLEYRGVSIGMTAQEVRAKLGEPLLKADDGDFYSFTEKETAQIAYNAAKRVNAVSVDYLGGVGAPDYKLVVGPDVEVKADGSLYKLVRYQSLGIWVYYNRTAGDVPLVTITLQKSVQDR